MHIGEAHAGAASRVLVRFSDDETLEGDAVSLDLDRPDFELVLVDPGANTRRALIPLPSVKFVTFDRRSLSTRRDLDDMQKVALHFVDGEVITGLLGDDPRRGRYGVQLELVSRAGDEVELLGIPYDSLKALFFLRTWDGGDDGGPQPDAEAQTTPLVDLLQQLRKLADSRDSGDIDDREFRQRRRAVLDLM
ncbi:MAG TPA: hypothetical protein VGQ42_06235 [Candidatus Dormibacteraeota bacterium]|nr:hypothetical protein [Candidatus Dormibacteraeota bacterium]